MVPIERLGAFLLNLLRFSEFDFKKKQKTKKQLTVNLRPRHNGIELKSFGLVH